MGGRIIQRRDHFRKLLDREPDDVRDLANPGNRGRQPWQMVPPNRGHAGIGQSNRIDHPPIELGNSRRRRSLPRLRTHGLGDQSTECGEIDHLRQLAPVSCGAGSKHDGILKIEPGRLHRERAAVPFHRGESPPPAPSGAAATRRS